MRIIETDHPIDDPAEFDGADAREADRYARMLDEIYIDGDLLDPESCPPDRRFFLADKEAWIYEHGNICELVFVRFPEG